MLRNGKNPYVNPIQPKGHIKDFAVLLAVKLGMV